MTERFSAIVFDVDGVLVDSEPLHTWTWEKVLTGYGIDIAPGEIDRYVGIPCTELFKDYRAREGDRLPESAMEEKRALFDEIMPERLRAMEGAPAVLRALHRRGMPLAAASNSPVGRVEKMLEIVGLWRYFTAAAGIDEVPHAKPAPDVYLLACERLGVAPSRCLAVEDSPTGVTAAVAAGMTVWGYAHGFGEKALEEAGARATIHTLSEMLRI